MRYKLICLGLTLGGCGLSYQTAPFQNTASTPHILEMGNISTSSHHENINYVSIDQRCIYFTRSSRDFEMSSLYRATFQDGRWGAAERLSFSGTHYDAGIHFSPSEREMFFTSKRSSSNPNLSREWNIWQVDIERDGQLGEPKILSEPINSKGQECCLTMNREGNAFFASNRDGSWDIYETYFSKGRFSKVEKLNSKVNSEDGEWPSYISNEGDMLLISSIRKSGFGGDDIYIVRKVDGEWTDPVILDSEINSDSYEDSPFLSSDGRTFFYSSWRDNEFAKGVSNIYFMEASKLLEYEAY